MYYYMHKMLFSGSTWRTVAFVDLNKEEECLLDLIRDSGNGPELPCLHIGLVVEENQATSLKFATCQHEFDTLCRETFDVR